MIAPYRCLQGVPSRGALRLLRSSRYALTQPDAFGAGASRDGTKFSHPEFILYLALRSFLLKNMSKTPMVRVLANASLLRAFQP